MQSMDGASPDYGREHEAVVIAHRQDHGNCGRTLMPQVGQVKRGRLDPEPIVDHVPPKRASKASKSEDSESRVTVETVTTAR